MDEPQAFPDENHYGLSQREYIASALMAGMMASGWLPDWVERGGTPTSYDAVSYAKAAVAGADALLAQLHR